MAAVTVPKLLCASVTEDYSLAQIASVWWQRGAARNLVSDCQGILILVWVSLVPVNSKSSNRQSLVFKILPPSVGSPFS